MEDVAALQRRCPDLDGMFAATAETVHSPGAFGFCSFGFDNALAAAATDGFDDALAAAAPDEFGSFGLESSPLGGGGGGDVFGDLSVDSLDARANLDPVAIELHGLGAQQTPGVRRAAGETPGARRHREVREEERCDDYFRGRQPNPASVRKAAQQPPVLYAPGLGGTPPQLPASAAAAAGGGAAPSSCTRGSQTSLSISPHLACRVVPLEETAAWGAALHTPSQQTLRSSGLPPRTPAVGVLAARAPQLLPATPQDLAAAVGALLETPPQQHAAAQPAALRASTPPQSARSQPSRRDAVTTPHPVARDAQGGRDDVPAAPEFALSPIARPQDELDVSQGFHCDGISPIRQAPGTSPLQADAGLGEQPLAQGSGGAAQRSPGPSFADGELSVLGTTIGQQFSVSDGQSESEPCRSLANALEQVSRGSFQEDKVAASTDTSNAFSDPDDSQGADRTAVASLSVRRLSTRSPSGLKHAPAGLTPRQVRMDLPIWASSARTGLASALFSPPMHSAGLARRSYSGVSRCRTPLLF